MDAHRSSRPLLGGERSTWTAFAGVMMLIIALDVVLIYQLRVNRAADDA